MLTRENEFRIATQITSLSLVNHIHSFFVFVIVVQFSINWIVWLEQQMNCLMSHSIWVGFVAWADSQTAATHQIRWQNWPEFELAECVRVESIERIVIGVETVTSAFTRCERFHVVNYLLIRMLNRKLAKASHQQQLLGDKAERAKKMKTTNQMSSFILHNECSPLIKRNYARNKAFN